MPPESVTPFVPGARVHFVGVGGAGMCGLAEAMARAGYTVTGSDLVLGPSVDALRALGVRLYQGHAAEHVGDATLVVRTAATDARNPEVAEAEARGVPVLKRAEALGRWVARGRVVAVAGTHGKTSTTTMITAVLAEAGLDPTAFVGGAVRAWGGNYRAGADRLFVVEADEYDRSFLHLDPDVAVVTNVEADHLDIYGDEEGVHAAFGAFLGRVRGDGTAVACADDPGARAVVQGRADAVTYGRSEGATLHVADVERTADGTRFTVRERGAAPEPLQIRVPGLHNVLNATAAAAAARALGVPWDAVRRGLAGYTGVGRRFERVGSAAGVDVLDDYAHHPTEVRATLDALRQAFPERRLVVVFQPHLFSRTRDFHDAFGAALAGADVVWVTDVYPAREQPLPGVTGALVADSTREHATGPVHYHAELATLPEAVARTLVPGDVCVTLGAGSIETVGSRLVRLLKEES